MGFLKGTKGYVLNSPSNYKIFVSMNNKFWEDDYIKNTKSRSRLVLKELSRDESSIPQRKIISQLVIKESKTEVEPTLPHRSGKVMKKT